MTMRMPGPKVMIVEDEFLIRFTLSEALIDEGFEVIEAATGNEALQTLHAHPDVALLLIDIQLPGGLDGREVARRARQMISALPVIFMSGHPENPSSGAGSPLDAFLAKPYLPSEVCMTVRRLTRC